MEGAIPFVLKKHIKVTHGEKKQCPECDYVTADKTLMRAHVRDKHTGIVIKCDICDKTYANTTTLKDHMKVAHLEKTVKCEHDGCERMFPTLIRMKTLTFTRITRLTINRVTSVAK